MVAPAHTSKPRFLSALAWVPPWPQLARTRTAGLRWQGYDSADTGGAVTTPLTDAQVSDAASSVAGTVTGRQLQTLVTATVTALTDAQVTAGTGTTPGTVTAKQLADKVAASTPTALTDAQVLAGTDTTTGTVSAKQIADALAALIPVLTDAQVNDPTNTTRGTITPQQIHNLLTMPEVVIDTTDGIAAEVGKRYFVMDGHDVNLPLVDGTNDNTWIMMFPSAQWETMTIGLTPTGGQSLDTAGATMNGRDALWLMADSALPGWRAFTAGDGVIASSGTTTGTWGP